MAQDITLLGAQYNDVPAVQLPKTGGGTARFDDASITTAVASDVTQGKVFLAADGTITTGTNSGGGGGAVVVIDEQLPGGGTAKHITAVDISDTTAVASDVASGKYFYTSSGIKTAGTASGGGSSWTKVAETTVTASTTTTSSTQLVNWNTGHSELWTSDKIVYVRIRDTEGKRAEYFYGSDIYIINQAPINASTSTVYISPGGSNAIRITSQSTYGVYTGTGYGVYVNRLYNDGTIGIYTRYSGSYSLTIDGTYKVEVYLLNLPTGAPIFT